MPSNSTRQKSGTPGIYYRERARFPGSKQRERVYCLPVKEAGKLRWVQTDAKGNDLLSLDAAKDRKAELARAKRQGAPVVKSTKVTFAEYADAWLPLQTELAPRTVGDYREKLARLKKHLGKQRLSDLNEANLDRAITALKQPYAPGKVYAPNTINGTLIPLGCLLDDAVAEGILGYNPLTALKARQKGKRRKGNLIPRARNLKRQRILESDEIDALLDAATSERYRVLLTVAVYTGLRQQELLGLTWGDIRFEERKLEVRAQLSRPEKGELPERVPLKSEKGYREVPLSDDLVALLREYRASTIYKQDADYIFTTSTGTPLRWNNVDKHALGSAVKRAKLREPHPKFHDLRHTYVSVLIAEGVDVKTVSVLVGHADAGFTLRVYAGLFDKAASDEKVRQAIGNPKVNGGARKGQERATGEVLPFPATPHQSEASAAQSG
jgi:integrase